MLVTDVSYALTNDAGGLFAIDSTTGVVTLSGELDYETATSHDITVLASSTDGSTAEAVFNAAVQDFDEYDVEIDPISAVSLSEDLDTGNYVTTAHADDLDGTDTVSYLLSNNAGGLFEIDSTSGVVTLSGGLDYETATSHDITVLASSTDGSTAEAIFNVAVQDFDEYDVGIDPISSVSLEENVDVGITIATAFAEDLDGTNNTISYALSQSSGGLFEIDSTTGVVTLSGELDYETATSHDITVLATSTDGSTAEAIFNVAVQDFDEYDVEIDSISPIELDEVAGIGDAIAIAHAQDLDGTNNTISYALSQSAGGLFAIDSESGFITLVDELNYKQDASHSITILATSTDGSTDEATYDITVNNQNSVSGIGDDKIYGKKADEVLYGHGGDDLIDGGKGEDELYGGAGDDRVLGGKDKSADRLFGEDGNDQLYGGKGNDHLEGRVW